jgi:hypothetical protein
VLGGCGGGGAETTTAETQPLRGTGAELRWTASAERFAGGLLPDLKRLERLTGGGGTGAAVGTRLDPRIFRPGPARRAFQTAMTSLAACGTTLRATLPKAPSPRFRPVRRTLVHACAQLELVPELLRAEVLRARSARDVDRSVLKEAAAHAGEGVRSIVDSLTSLRRLLGARR